MDPMHHHHQNSDNQDAQNLDGNGSYDFNNAPADSFNHFFNPDPATSFANPWDPEVLSDPRIQANGFAQGNDAWHHQNSLGAANTLHNPPFGVQSRDFSNAYVRNSSAFRYSNFDHPSGPSFGSPAFDPALYGSDNYEIDRSQGYTTQGQTISPQALQSYSYGQFSASGEQDTQFAQEPLSNRPPESTRASDKTLDQRTGNAIHVNVSGERRPVGRSGDEFAPPPPATKPKKFSSFIFLGGAPNIEEFAEDDILERVPKRHRRSRNELKYDLNKQQGIQPEPKDDDLKEYFKQLSIRRPKAVRQGSSTAVSSSSSEDSTRDSESASQSGSDDGSDYISDSEDEPLSAKPAILLSARPGHPAKAVEYDIVKSVWRKGKVITSAQELRQALGDFWNTIKPIRDQWQLDVASAQQAETKKDTTGVEQAKSRASRQRQYLEIAMRVALEHGHRDILARFGDNPHLLLFFYKLIIDRFIENDFNGRLVTDIISLVIRCSTVDQSLLEKTKLDKALTKLLKRGDDTVKALSQEALDRVARYTKQKESEVKSVQKPLNGLARGAGPNDSVVPGVRGTQPTSSLKRQRESNAAPLQPAKKVATTASSSKPSTNPSIKVTGSSNKGKAVPKSDSKSPTNSNATAVNTKTKVNHVVAKPSSFFSSLQSASKKPGTSNAALRAAQNSDGKNRSTDGKGASTSNAASAAPKPAFSFAETMANLTKPKEVTSTTKSTENLPPETEEEKTKRLRKEERRKLRVTFKPQETLVEIRTFVHDPEEDMGHDDNMIRDVGDIGSEGRMLKMHKEKELEGLDDEDDGVEIALWAFPSLVDFSVIDAEELARSCSTRGGKIEVKSRERAIQEQRELTTLMAFYSTISDIPSSPREPHDPYSGDSAEEHMFGTPQDETRHREAQYYAEKNLRAHPYQPTASTGGTTQTTDISAILQMLNGQQQPQQIQQYQQPQQPHTTQGPTSDLEALFAKYSTNSLSAGQTPAPPQQSVLDPSLIAALGATNWQNQPQTGYVQPSTSQPDLSSLLAGIISQPATQQQTYGFPPTQQNENERKRHYDNDYESRRNNDSYYKRAKGNTGKKYTADAPYTGIKHTCQYWLKGSCKKGDQCTYLHDYE